MRSGRADQSTPGYPAGQASPPKAAAAGSHAQALMPIHTGIVDAVGRKDERAFSWIYAPDRSTLGREAP